MKPPRIPIAVWLMTGLGSGFAPAAPGTFGSAAAIVMAAFVLPGMGTASDTVIGFGFAVLAIAAVLGCVRWTPDALAFFEAASDRSAKKGDPGQVVLDEWAGQWVALIAMPAMADSPGRCAMILAVQFVLFRFFDITKPPPIRRVEKLPGGWGIALDDVVAGLYANLIGQVLFRHVWGG